MFQYKNIQSVGIFQYKSIQPVLIFQYTIFRLWGYCSTSVVPLACEGGGGVEHIEVVVGLKERRKEGRKGT
jgi:hypothetical protein